MSEELKTNEYVDPLYEQAVIIVRDDGEATVSKLQRVFYIGYNRAARLIESMEEAGVIGPLTTGSCRKVLTRKD